MTQAAAEVLLLPLDALDRADMPVRAKDSLRKSIIAIAGAYGEDDDPQKVAPDPKSFMRLLRVLEHPHHWSWRPPAIAVDPEGNFSAIWDEPGVHRWILDFLPNGEVRETYLRTYPDGRIEHNSQAVNSYAEVQPPFAIG